MADAPQAVSLDVRDVHKQWQTAHGVVDVLRGITFEIASGESLAITGPSGAGKSTLLHIIGTLEAPSAGQVTLNGADPFALDEPELARFRNTTVGFVFQDHHLLPQYDVIENVLLPTLATPRDARPSDDALRARAEELLEGVGLGHRLRHRPAALSGGERQRVAVARALINQPRLLLCDEPTGSLDANSATRVADLLLDLHHRHDTVLIAVTHSLDLAARFERRFELRDGVCSAR
ncbi:MAG: ABC transporter ATP-binding protein [Acidobacteriota bacterium]